VADRDPPGTPFGAAFRWLSAPETTQVLAILGAGLAALAVLIPQGPEAMAIAEAPGATRLHALAAWGLTDLFASRWFHAYVALVVGNVAAVLLAGRGSRVDAARAPAAHEAQLELKRPELGVELVRERLIAALGAPSVERVDGARVELWFSPGDRPALGRLMTLGAGAFGASAGDRRTTLPHVVLAVRDGGTGASGTFDVVGSEPIRFFQQKTQYLLRDVDVMRLGLGPAALFEAQEPDGSGRQFWVYQHAPEGFDARHRKGGTTLQALEIGLSPRPGMGLSGSPFAIVMAAGLMLVALGVVWSARPRGALEVVVGGKNVTLRGRPERAGDATFQRAFERWVAGVRAANEDAV
jgi:hypothetical protein